jgi:hypothetical protein
MYKVKYKVVRTSDTSVEIVNGKQSGVYDVEMWEWQFRAKEFWFTRIVQSDLTFEEATAIRNSLQFPGRFFVERA